MGFLWISVWLSALAFVQASRPNIVFILVDDLGYNDIGYHAKFHGSGMKTPHLDKLAREGVKLENYYVQPICTPSRSQLMSGRYQIHTGLQHGVIDAGQPNALPLDNKILPQQLKNCGYDTHMVGKWHLGSYAEEFLPQNRGFNTFFGYINGMEDYYNHSFCSEVSSCGVDMRDTYGPLNETWGEYSTYVFTDKAKEVISNRDKTKPLFLYLAYQSVHRPLQVPKQYEEPFLHIKDEIRRTYAGMLYLLDEAVKNVTDHLQMVGIYDNTILIFSTDNGGQPIYGGNNWPLRGEKNTLWEGGVKGVGFITGKPLRVTSITSENFMHVSDWFPTILTATRCPVMAGTQDLDGLDQWGAIMQRESSPRAELLHNIDPLRGKPTHPKIVHGFDISTYSAIRSGPWKLLTGNQGFSDWVKPPESHQGASISNSEVTSSYKRSAAADVDEESPKLPMLQLFHIKSDPYERHEISRLFPTEVVKLLRKLAAYNATAVQTRYPPVDEKANPKYHNGYWGPWLKNKSPTEAPVFKYL